jgi:hypothetical protein
MVKIFKDKLLGMLPETDLNRTFNLLKPFKFKSFAAVLNES